MRGTLVSVFGRAFDPAGLQAVAGRPALRALRGPPKPSPASAHPANAVPDELRAFVAATERIAPTRMVYLSPDAPRPIEALDRSSVYVLGGVVDRTRQRFLTLDRAADLGYDAARLPLAEHVRGITRSTAVLTIDQAFEILLRMAQQTESWGEVVPLRRPPAQTTPHHSPTTSTPQASPGRSPGPRALAIDPP